MLCLKEERQKRGWSIFELSLQSKIHPATLGKLESGRMKPYTPHLEKIEKIFGIPAHELFKEVKK